MKNFIFTLFLLCILAAGAFGAEVTSRALPSNLKGYIKLFDDKVQPDTGKERIGGNYYKYVIGGSNRNAVAPFAQIEGDPTKIDTTLEWLYASYYHAAVRDIRPSGADAILPVNNPKLVDQIIGAETLRDIQIARFLGNTDAVGRYEGGLKFITDRGNATRAEIETYYRNGIRGLVSQIVDEQVIELKNANLITNVSTERLAEVKRAITDFMLAPNSGTYRELLLTSRRNTGDAAMVLGFTVRQINYEVYRALVNNRVLGAQ